MTGKEAYNVLMSSTIETECMGCEYECRNCEFYHAHNMAVDALRKQIPMKPAHNDEHYWFCPACGEVVYSEIDKIENEYSHNYCSGCGQKLDWREPI